MSELEVQSLKVLLNLLAATAGGQITRARAFLDRFEHVMPGAQLVVLKEAQVLTEVVSRPGREVINVPIGLGRFKAVRRMWWENTAMVALIRARSPNVYLTFSHYLPARDIAIPSVVGVSNLAPFSSEAWSHESLLVRLKMAALRHTIVSSAKRASCVLALSQTCRDVLVAQGVPLSKIVVTPNGVDTGWSDPPKGLIDLVPLGITQPYLLYVSHFHRYKNHVRLVDAFAALPVGVRQAYQLVLVGKPDSQSCYEETSRRIKELGLVKQVIMIPGLSGDTLKALYQRAALFVFPSLIENSPNILLEAMMAGAPVATCNLAPMPEFCQSAAVYFDALDTSDMSSVMATVLQSPALLSDLRGRATAQARLFSWDTFAQQMARHIDMALS